MVGMSYLLILLIGVCTGLRTMTPIAVICWFAYLHHLALTGWRGYAASLVSVVIFTLAALGELYGDKLPTTPSRIAPLGIGARVIFASLCAAILAEPLLFPAVISAPYWMALTQAIVIGIVGALVGSYGGWFVRTRSVAALKCADWNVAVVEDAVAILMSIVALVLASRIVTVAS
jgi:uncharacterized membrane protein